MSSHECVICMERLSNETGMTDCKHKFCKACIMKWINECSECPLCRAQITRIRFFKNGFYTGEETGVQFKQQKIPDDDDISLFIDDNVIEDYDEGIRTCPSPTIKGTVWRGGHRRSARSHEVENPLSSIFESMTRQVQMAKKLKETKEVSNKVFDALTETAQKLVFNGSATVSAAHECVMKICDEEKGKCVDDDDSYIKVLIHRLESRLLRNNVLNPVMNHNKHVSGKKKVLIPTYMLE